MEYLKNLVLQLYTTGEGAALLPVFAALLAFSPEERHKAQQVRRKIMSLHFPGFLHIMIVLSMVSLQGLDALLVAEEPQPGDHDSLFSRFTGWLGSSSV